MNMWRTLIATALLARMTMAMTAFAASAASDFEGVWTVKDSSGKPFEITLSGDGKASTTEAHAGAGTWKEEGGAAVIRWTSGWTTKIAKEGDHYVKTAFKKGTALDGPPTNSSDAAKK